MVAKRRSSPKQQPKEAARTAASMPPERAGLFTKGPGTYLDGTEGKCMIACEVLSSYSYPNKTSSCPAILCHRRVSCRPVASQQTCLALLRVIIYYDRRALPMNRPEYWPRLWLISMLFVPRRDRLAAPRGDGVTNGSGRGRVPKPAAKRSQSATLHNGRGGLEEWGGTCSGAALWGRTDRVSSDVNCPWDGPGPLLMHRQSGRPHIVARKAPPRPILPRGRPQKGPLIGEVGGGQPH